MATQFLSSITLQDGTVQAVVFSTVDDTRPLMAQDAAGAWHVVVDGDGNAVMV